MTPTFIIAEIGSVHDGSFGNARNLVEAAARAGADAIKFQIHIAGAETLPDAPSPSYFQGESRYEYFERTAFSRQQWSEIKSHCEKFEVEFLASPFSNEAVVLLEGLGVKRHKVGSGEITNIPLLDLVGQTKKPVILSSGMSTWAELNEAVVTIQKYHQNIVLLQCTSEYPCSPDEVGLNLLAAMQERFNLPVGLSDHTLTNYASFAAVTLGASVIEKHFTFSRSMYGSDARHSLLPDEFADLVKGIRAIDQMGRHPVDKDRAAERLTEMKRIFEKSIVSLCDIQKGATISADMLGLKKPGDGLPARKLPELIGKQAARFVRKNTVIQLTDLNA